MRRWTSAGAVLLACAGLASADTLDLGGGWQATWTGGGDIGITVDDVTPDAVLIEISKDFDDPPINGAIPGRPITFVQTADDAGTVSRIVIRDETITNLTGVDWTDYQWDLIGGSLAWLNVPLSQDWSVTPFGSKVFSDPGNVFNDPDRATRLSATGGLISNFGSFFPGLQAGDLVIDVDLSGPTPVTFVLDQFAAPEPASLGMLVVSAVALALRRR